MIGHGRALEPGERCLILVKHASPVVTPGVPPARWPLSDAGRASCGPLAERLRAYGSASIAASDEPKASETAHLLAAGLGQRAPIRHDHDLREHERRPEDFFADTAAEARFTAAVRRFLDDTPNGNPIVVAHGTVISLFVAAHAGVEPFALWKSLQLPSYVVLALPDLRHIVTCAAVLGSP